MSRIPLRQGARSSHQFVKLGKATSIIIGARAHTVYRLERASNVRIRANEEDVHPRKEKAAAGRIGPP